MSQVVGTFDAEIAEMLDFYRVAATRADQQGTPATFAPRVIAYSPLAQREPLRAIRSRVCRYPDAGRQLVSTRQRRQEAP